MNMFGYLSYFLLGATLLVVFFKPEDISTTQQYLIGGVFIAMAVAALAKSEVDELREWIRRKYELSDSKEGDNEVRE